MCYLKIYPKRIIANLASNGAFEGVFTLLIEQYGLGAIDKKCDVKIFQDAGKWALSVQPISGVGTPQFSKFVDTLSHYLFSASKFNPNLDGRGLPRINYFFENVHFNIN